MEQDREQLCGPKHPQPARQAYRGRGVPNEVVLGGGRRIVLVRLRARRVTGEEHPLPSYLRMCPGSARRPHAGGNRRRRQHAPVCAHARPPAGRPARAGCAASRVDHHATDQLPGDAAGRARHPHRADRGLHFRDYVILLAVGVDPQGGKHVLVLAEGTAENAAAVCKALLAEERQRAGWISIASGCSSSTAALDCGRRSRCRYTGRGCSLPSPQWRRGSSRPHPRPRSPGPDTRREAS